MRKFILAAILSLIALPCFAQNGGYSSPSVGGGSLAIQQGGVAQGAITTFNCSTNLTCSVAGSVVTVTASGSGSAVVLQTNTVSNTSQALLNFTTSSTNTAGLTVTPSNPSGGIEVFEITGTLACASIPAFTGGVTRSGCAMTLANPSASTLGGVESITVVSHKFLTGISTSGVPSQAQPAYADISGTPTATSVALTVPSWLTVTGSPVAPNGTLAVAPTAAQTSHQVIGTCGSATTFGPCSLATGDLPTGIPLANIAASGSANVVMGALTATTPSYLAVPSCSGVSNALIWTSGTGFGCNTISSGGTVTTSGTITVGSLAEFQGATAIESGNLTNDVTTSGSMVATVVGINGTNLAGLGAGILKQNGSGAPAIAVSGTDYVVPSVATLSSLASVGTIATGTWQGTPIGLSYMSQLFVSLPETTTYQVLAADFAGCKTISVASGTFTITLVASGSQPASGQCIRVINYGSGVVTVARSGQNINGAAANLTLAAGSASAPNVVWIVSDGTNYEAQVIAAGSGTGTVNNCSVSTGAIAYYSASGTAVSCDANIQDGGSGQFVLGISGTQAGSLKFVNATSGGIIINPPTGALGSPTLTLPTVGGTLAASGTAPISVAVTGAISLLNSASANVTAALGTDTKYFTASGSAAVNGNVISGDSSGGINDSGVAVPQKVFLTSQYTNSSSGYTSLSGLSFAVAASTNYMITCNMVYQTSSGSVGPNFQWTGPASPTAVSAGLTITGNTTAAIVRGVGNHGTAFTSTVTAPTYSSFVTATDFPAIATLSLINGTNAGTIQLQAENSAAGTITIQAGSSCEMH